MKKMVLDIAENSVGNIRVTLLEGTLTDGSKVYSVEAKDGTNCIEFDCVDRDHANRMFQELSE